MRMTAARAWSWVWPCLGALALGTVKVVPLSVAGLAGMLAMIVTGCVDARRAFRVDWRVVLLIGSMMALGVAMEESGAGKFLGNFAAGLGEYGGPRTVLLVMMTLTILLSAPMSNQAAAPGAKASPAQPSGRASSSTERNSPDSHHMSWSSR